MRHETFVALARELRCESAALEAVAEVESAGSGFQPDGRPRILFEAHIFARETRGRFNATHPDISSPTWNRALYVGGAGEWRRLERAMKLDHAAALKSASWGAFQIMGFNFGACGFASVEDMVKAHETEAGQLRAFARFLMRNPGMLKALQTEDWTTFARMYNGTGQVPTYSARMDDAYRRFLVDGLPDYDFSDTAQPVELPVPEVDRALPFKPAWESKTVITGTAGALAGVGAIADQAGTVGGALSGMAGAVYSASSLGDAATRFLSSPALPWILTAVAVVALGVLTWRYIGKIRRGEVIVH